MRRWPTEERRAEVLAANAVRHGTDEAYVYWQCRCEMCRAANAATHQSLRRSRTPDMAKAHGTRSTYSNYNCRCEPCTAANRKLK